MEVEIILVAVLMIAIYATFVAVLLNSIDYAITKYNGSEKGIEPLEVAQYIRMHNKELIRVSALLFPLFLCFAYGMLFGDKLYTILIDDKDENRIASWVI